MELEPTFCTFSIDVTLAVGDNVDAVEKFVLSYEVFDDSPPVDAVTDGSSDSVVLLSSDKSD